MSPYMLKILLHYYVSPLDYRVNAGDQVNEEAMAFFVHADLLRQGIETMYEITERGKYYCEALQRLPLPEHRWHVPGLDDKKLAVEA